MDKEALTSVAVIGLLLIVIVIASVFNKRQELVAVRPDLNQVNSKVLTRLLGNQETPTDESEAGSCPVGCVAQATPEPTPDTKKQWQQDPVPYVRDRINTHFAKQLANGEADSNYITNTTMWWRSPDEDYRILVPAGKTLTVSVPTTAKAYTLTPEDKNQQHPALRHPLLAQVEKEITTRLKKLDFKKSSFNHCPVNESYDPFDNCVATFTKNDQRCNLIAGYGQSSSSLEPDKPYLRLELTCSDQYQQAYNQAAPYLYTINLINPPWLAQDTAVYHLQNQGELIKVDFGYHQAYFQPIDDGLRMLETDNFTSSCALHYQNGTQQIVQLNCR